MLGNPETRIGVNGQRGEAIAAHDDRVFPNDLRARDDLTHRDHASRDGRPDLQAVDHRHIVAFPRGRTDDDGQEACFLGIDAGLGAAGLAVEADGPTLETRFDGPRDFDAGHAVAAGLLFEHDRPNHFLFLAPVMANTDGAAVVVDDRFDLLAESADHGRVGPLDAHLDAAASARAEQEFFRDGVGVGMLLVELFLDRGDEAVDFLVVVDIDQELDIGPVLRFGRVDEKEAACRRRRRRWKRG